MRAALDGVGRAVRVALVDGSAALFEGATERVCTTQRHDITVVHSILAEDEAEMKRRVQPRWPVERRLRGRESKRRLRRVGRNAVLAAVDHRDGRTTADLDCDGGGHGSDRPRTPTSTPP
eukprot:2101488-Prymnesium_polylepis.1